MTTTNLRFSNLIARMQDLRYTTKIGPNIAYADGAELVQVEFAHETGSWIDAIACLHPNGCYDLYVQQPSPLIEDDAEFVEDARILFGRLPLHKRA